MMVAAWSLVCLYIESCTAYNVYKKRQPIHIHRERYISAETISYPIPSPLPSLYLDISPPFPCAFPSLSCVLFLPFRFPEPFLVFLFLSPFSLSFPFPPLVYSCSNSTSLNKLKIKQKEAIRIISNAGYRRPPCLLS